MAAPAWPVVVASRFSGASPATLSLQKFISRRPLPGSHSLVIGPSRTASDGGHFGAPAGLSFCRRDLKAAGHRSGRRIEGIENVLAIRHDDVQHDPGVEIGRAHV